MHGTTRNTTGPTIFVGPVVIESRGPARGHVFRVFLTPVSAMKHPAASGVNPARGNPNHAGSRWTHPPSRHPYIRVSVPPLVSTDPDISRSGSDSNDSNSSRRRRRDTNYRHLRNSDPRSHQEYKQECKPIAGHLLISLQSSLIRSVSWLIYSWATFCPAWTTTNEPRQARAPHG